MPPIHLRDGEREGRRNLSADRTDACIVTKALSREKHPVVEDPRAPEKAIKAAASPAIKPAAIQYGTA